MPKYEEYQKVRVLKTGEVGTIVDILFNKKGKPYYYLEILLDGELEVLDFKEEELESI